MWRFHRDCESAGLDTCFSPVADIKDVQCPLYQVRTSAEHHKYQRSISKYCEELTMTRI